MRSPANRRPTKPPVESSPPEVRSFFVELLTCKNPILATLGRVANPLTVFGEWIPAEKVCCICYGAAPAHFVLEKWQEFWIDARKPEQR